jgi:hypothetical protein
VVTSCGASPQARDEASITYRIKFSAEPGASTRVIFPLPTDAAQQSVENTIQVADGGTFSLVDQAEGLGAALDGHGDAEASFLVKNLKGFPESSGAPDASLSMHQPDAGPAEMYLRVNKGGFATVNVEFEYTASRDCGNGCGGTRSWKFSGAVGLALQSVHMDYVEENR